MEGRSPHTLPVPLMLLWISQARPTRNFAHTCSFRRSPCPRRELALCPGPSPGRQAAAMGGRPRVFPYLFIYLKGQRLHRPGSASPRGQEEGTLMPGPLMSERKDGEMVPRVTCVGRAW